MAAADVGLRLTSFEQAVRERSAPNPAKWPHAAWCGCAKSWTRGVLSCHMF